MTGSKAISVPLEIKIIHQKRHHSFLKNVADRFFYHRFAVLGFLFLSVEIILLFTLPHIINLDPITSDFAEFEAAPSVNHLLGTDDLGRDVFARLIYGGQVSLYVGFISALISVGIGLPLGLIAGYYHGIVETVIMRTSEIFLSIPSMILILVVVSIMGNSLEMLTIVIGIMGWPGFARLIYGNVLSEKEKEYVIAAKAIGEKDADILLRYILPNSITPILIAFTFKVASAIIQESSLSFLGLGVQPPQTSWGNMLYGAQSITVLAYKLWRWLPAGILLILTVSAINFVGDGLQDALHID